MVTQFSDILIFPQQHNKCVNYFKIIMKIKDIIKIIINILLKFQ